ncbi:23885_t:CDS:1, partial [Entrophospora sp. SA101]
LRGHFFSYHESNIMDFDDNDKDDNGKSKPKVSKSTVSKRKSRLIVDDNDNNKNYISNKKEN